MRTYRFIIFFLIFLGAGYAVNGQAFKFPCDPETTAKNRIIYFDPITERMDSLLGINSRETDFSLRIWHNSAGMAGRTQRLFVMNYDSTYNSWKVITYLWHFRPEKEVTDTLQTLNIYSQEQWQMFWKKLELHQILTLKPLKPNTGLTIEDAHSSYQIDLVNNNCSRSYYIDWLLLDYYKQQSEIDHFRNIVRLLETALKENNIH